jgi:hypothetical protein
MNREDAPAGGGSDLRGEASARIMTETSVEIAKESQFDVSELFFSRTDQGGIILSGNSVFQRVSMYGWDELINKPHKIIRHRDMPRAVFYLLWDFLKKGKPIGAYVKNRAKDGSFYWVFAIATPIRGGYLSVRLKPSCGIREVVEREYAAVLDAERVQKLTSAQSAELVLAALKRLGFASYDDFMSVAIAKELAARNAAMGRSRDTIVGNFEAMLTSSQVLLSETRSIIGCFEANRYVPLNLQVLSAQLGAHGRSIGVISEDYSRVSNEIQQRIGAVTEAAAALVDKIYAVNFLLCIARAQDEVCHVFAEESLRAHDQQDRATDSDLLHLQSEEYCRRAEQGLVAVLDQIRDLQDNCREMRRLATSLDVIRIMGSVSSSGLSVNKSLFDGLMNDLKSFQSGVADRLAKIEQIRVGMDSDTRKALHAIAA